MDLVNALLDQSGQLIAVLDCETARMVDCNDALCRATGRTREELVGKPLPTEEEWSAVFARIEAQPGLVVETQFRRPDGSLHPVRFECTVHERDGQRYVLAIQAPRQARFGREANWQKALYRMAAHPAMSSGRFTEAAAFIAATGPSVFPADHCRIWRLDGERLTFVMDNHGPLRPGIAASITLSDFPWVGPVLITGRCTDLYQSCRTEEEREQTRALAAVYGCKAVLCAPIRLGGRIWGALTVGNESERQWQPDEIGFAGELADQIAHALSSEELRVSEERYRSFVEMSAEAVWRVAFTEPVSIDLPVEEQTAAVLERGYIVDCNAAFGRILGRPSQEFIGEPIRTVLAPIDETRWAEIRQMVESNYRLVDLEVRHRDLWALRSVTGMVENGRLVTLWGASRDITERKRAEQLLAESEQRYRAFVANSSEGIFRIEYSEPVPLTLHPEEIVRRTWETGTIAESNEAMAQMFGFVKPADLLGRRSNEFLLPTQYDSEEAREFLRQGCRIVDLEGPSRRADGTVCWFSHSMIGVVEDQSLVRIWGRVTDVTARRALEAELRALSAHRASILEQERARIAREIHDELGQQLTALKFEAAAWERGARRPGKGDLTQSIDAAIQTVRRIATDLRPAILDHFGLVAAIEWMSADVSRRTGIECDCDLQPGLEVSPALATTVFRIFQEAVTNAARHSGAKMVQVRLRTIGGRLELTVQDDGRGFTNTGGSSTTSLGLVGMRERAKDAGGAVSVSGVPGRGTRVAAWFPLEAAA